MSRSGSTPPGGKPGRRNPALMTFPSNTCTFPASTPPPTITRPRRAAGSKRCQSSRRRQNGSTTPATPGTEARPLSPPAASAAKSSRPTPGAAITARGISPLAWCALRTAAATATACISWPRAVTALRPAAAGTTARQAPAACAAPSTVTRGTTARTGKIRAVTDTRPASSRFPVTAPAPDQLAGCSSPPARPPKPACTAGNASQPDRPHGQHYPSRNSAASRSCAARWPTLTPTAAARLSSSSKRAAGTRPRFSPRDGNALTAGPGRTRRRFAREMMAVPGEGRATGHRMGPCARSAAPSPRVSTRNLVPSQVRRIWRQYRCIKAALTLLAPDGSVVLMSGFLYRKPESGFCP